jgi:hypothetical protein
LPLSAYRRSGAGRGIAQDRCALLPLVYPLLSGAVVYGLFESGDRQHMFAVGPLIVLAAVGIAQREAAPRAGAHAARA